MKTIRQCFIYTLGFLLSLAFSFPLYAQEGTSLEELLLKAEKNYPSAGAGDLYDAALNASLAAERASLRPMVNVGAQASWQSDVTSVDIQIPPDLPFAFDLNIPEPSKDSYRLTLDVAQRIYQGGAIKAQEKDKMLENSIQKEQLRADISQWKQQTASCFFTIHFQEVAKKVTQAYVSDLEARLEVVESGIRNGMVDAASGNILKAEITSLQQKISEQESSIQANREYLAILTGDKNILGSKLSVTPVLPDTSAPAERPELKIVSLNADRLENASSLLQTYKLPSVSGFGQLGYGRPGLNMLSNEFSPFAIVGLKFSWTLWDNQLKQHRQDALEVQRQITGLQQESIRKNLDGQLRLRLADIKKYEVLIVQDNELLKLREAVSKAYVSQLENGVITDAEYIRQKNEELRTRLSLEAHRIGLEQARAAYLFTTGKW